jgi:hypothetical protein
MQGLPAVTVHRHTKYITSLPGHRDKPTDLILSAATTVIAQGHYLRVERVKSPLGRALSEFSPAEVDATESGAPRVRVSNPILRCWVSKHASSPVGCLMKGSPGEIWCYSFPFCFSNSGPR